VWPGAEIRNPKSEGQRSWNQKIGVPTACGIHRKELRAASPQLNLLKKTRNQIVA
jgi:hypothetical protein